MLRSTTICPARRCASSSSTTASIARLSGSESSTTSASRASAASDAAAPRAGVGGARGVEVEADHVLAAVHEPARDAPAHVPQADDADGHAPSSSMRIGTPTAHEWIPMTLTSSMTSMISSRVAPSPSALRMCARRPGS